MKKILLNGIAILAVLVMALGTASKAQAAPATSQSCSVNVQGQEVCYEYVDPLDPVYGECPQGFDPVDGNAVLCQKLVEGYETAPQPVLVPESWDCPGPITWSYTYQGVTYSVTFSYDKDEHDPHKCHRPSDNNTPPSGWPGYVRGRFNQDNPEFLPAEHHNAVYADCSTLGESWEQDPSVDHGCRKYGSHLEYANREVISIGGCPEGSTQDGTACKVVVECPTLDCDALKAKFRKVGLGGLTSEEKAQLKTCISNHPSHPPKSAGESNFYLFWLKLMLWLDSLFG